MDLLAVPGYPGYAVDPQGRVFSTRRGDPSPMRPYAVNVDRRPYVKVVCASPSGRPERRSVSVAELVLLASGRPRPDGMQAKYLDGNVHDNRPANLGWAPPSEMPRAPYRRYRDRKMNALRVRAVRKMREAGASVAEIAERHGCSQITVRRVLNKKSWAHL